jgi:hypothetical protein
MLLSCRKPGGRDTIEPKPYLPVYPGSEWIYLDENSNTVKHTTAAEYQLHQYIDSKTGKKTKKRFVPYWNDQPVYEYSIPRDLTHSGIEGSDLFPILFEEIGRSEVVSTDHHGPNSSITALRKETSVQVDANTFYDVIVIGNYYTARFTYYARNVGLILREHIDRTVTPHDTIATLRLQSWHINN